MIYNLLTEQCTKHVHIIRPYSPSMGMDGLYRHIYIIRPYSPSMGMDGLYRHICICGEKRFLISFNIVKSGVA